MSDRFHRLSRWHHSSPELMLSLPDDYRAHVFAELKQQARKEFAQARVSELEAMSTNRWSLDLYFFSKVLVALLGAVAFSLAPRLLAIQAAEGNEDIVTPIALIGGAIACFYTNAIATQVLTDLKLRGYTAQRRRTLLDRFNQLEPHCNPEAYWLEAQLKLLDEVEGKHRIKPTVFAVLFAVGATLIEAGAAFKMLNSDDSDDPYRAVIVALFSTVLLWVIAYFQANSCKIPQHFDELRQEYGDELDFGNNTVILSIEQTLNELQLIPDKLEAYEYTIDHYINWLTQDNPDSNLTTKEMVELDAKIAYFEKRQQELTDGCDQLICRYLEQFKQDCTNLEQTKPTVIRIGAPHQIELREKQWLDTKLDRLKTIRDDQINLIRGRYLSLIQECDHRITGIKNRLVRLQQQ